MNANPARPRTRRRSTWVGTATAGLALVFSCSGNVGDGRGYLGGEAGIVAACPKGPSSCPAPYPTYTKDVAPILAAHCVGCHQPGGETPDPSLATYSAVSSPKTRSTLVSLAAACTMPPPPLPALSAEELATLECWLHGGAKR